MPTYVAPYAGAWIETGGNPIAAGVAGVAPYAGAWIETMNHIAAVHDFLSLPTRERGLKQNGWG